MTSPFQRPALWDRWRNLRIVTTTASELADGPVPPACYRQWNDTQATTGLPDDRTQIALAARWNGLIVGGAILEMRGGTSIIRTLYVDPAWRGRGVGRRLLRHLLRRARLQLVRDVYILATAADAGFYALHGFRPADEQVQAVRASDRSAAAVSTADEARIPMRRRLTLGLVNSPSDGITVKL